jgi:hypothetical protein
VPGMVGHVALRKTGFWGAPIYRLARPRLGVLVGSGALALGPAHAGGDPRSRRRPPRPASAGRPRRVRCAGARPGSRWRRSSIPAASPSPGLGWALSSDRLGLVVSGEVSRSIGSPFRPALAGRLPACLVWSLCAKTCAPTLPQRGFLSPSAPTKGSRPKRAAVSVRSISATPPVFPLAGDLPPCVIIGP